MGQSVIPKQAIIAAREAMREVTPPPGVSKSDWLEEYGSVALIAGAIAAAAPHMRATVSTVAELDALPRFSVIRDANYVVFERQTMWHEAGSRDLKYSPDIELPATVLQFGWGEE